MNPTLLARIIGVLAIIGSGISFLLEGWHDLNGLEKYLGFYGFIITLFLLAEFLKETEATVSKIFAGLTLSTAPVLMAQLGAFLFHPTDTSSVVSWLPQMKLPKNAPLTLITIGSSFVYVSLILRSLNLLKSSYPYHTAFYIFVSSALFLVPLRSSSFHALGIISLTFLALFSYRRFQFEGMANPFSQLICLASSLFFIARNFLYEIDDPILITFYFIGAVINLRFMPQFSTKKIHTQIFHTIGYIFTIFCVFKLLTCLFSFSSLQIVFLNEMILILIIGRHTESKKVGFFLLNFFAWSHLVVFCLSKNHLGIGEVLMSLGIPALLTLFSLHLREKSAFYSSLFILLLTFIYNINHLIQFPVVNFWIVLASLGILLLILSPFIQFLPEKITEMKNKMKKVFDQKS